MTNATFTIRLKEQPDKNRPDFVKIMMIIYKDPYPRLPKVLPITGLNKNWDQATQRFRPRTNNATALNAMLAEKIEEFDIIGRTWDKQGMKWTPKQLSH